MYFFHPFKLEKKRKGQIQFLGLALKVFISLVAIDELVAAGSSEIG